MAAIGQSSARLSGGTLSIQAYSWAIDQQLVSEPTTQLVLMCLAYYAGVDGCNAFPSVARLARDSRLSERAVQKALKRLVELGVIEPGNSAIAAAHIRRSDKRPKNYNIVLRGERGAPRKANGVNNGRHGVNVVRERGERGAPDPVSDPSINHKSALEAVEAELKARFGIRPETKR